MSAKTPAETYAAQKRRRFRAGQRSGPDLTRHFPAKNISPAKNQLRYETSGLRLLAALSHPAGSLGISFAGQELPVYSLGGGAYGVNLSGYGGATGELRFTAPDLPGGPNDIYLDAIVFSPQAIPEPATLALGTLGALVLSWRVRKRNV